jgi:leucyl aminopeptidase
LTFDSGGYNIKAGAGSLIEVMKIDMVRGKWMEQG